MEKLLQDIQAGNFLSSEKNSLSLLDYLSSGSLNIETLNPTVVSSVYSFITPELLELLSIEFNIDIENPEEVQTVIEKHFINSETKLTEKEINSIISLTEKEIVSIFQKPEVFNFIINQIINNDSIYSQFETKLFSNESFSENFTEYLVQSNNQEFLNYSTEIFNNILNTKIEQLEKHYNNLTNIQTTSSTIVLNKPEYYNEDNETLNVVNNILSSQNIENLENLSFENNYNIVDEINSLINLSETENSPTNISNISNITNSSTFQNILNENVLNENIINSLGAPESVFNYEMIEHITNKNKTSLIHPNTSSTISDIKEFMKVIPGNQNEVVQVTDVYENVNNVFSNEYLQMLSSLPQEDASIIIEKHLHNNVTNVENKIQNLKNEIVEMIEKKDDKEQFKSSIINTQADKVQNKIKLNSKNSTNSKSPIIRELTPAPRNISPLPEFPMIGYD